MVSQKQLERMSLALSAPVITLFVLIILTFLMPTGALSRLKTFLIGLLLLVVIPVIPIVYASRKGWVDIEVFEKDERFGFFFNALCSYTSAFLVYQATQTHTLLVLSAAYALITAVFILINRYWKISVHAAGTAGPVTALFWMFGPIALPLYVFTIAIIWVRLKLGAHTLMQTVTGALLAIVLTTATYMVLY